MSRDITFQVLAVSKVLSRLDVSDNFWVQYGVPRKELKKQVGLYEAENINNAYILAIAVNPKEYFEKYKNYSVHFTDFVNITNRKKLNKKKFKS